MPDPTRNQLIALSIITFAILATFAMAFASEVLARH